MPPPKQPAKHSARETKNKNKFETRYAFVSKTPLGSGTYGEVYKVRDRLSGIVYALKNMKLQDRDEGVPPTAVREVSIMMEMKHENLVRLEEVLCVPNAICLVMELVDGDLKNFIRNSKQTSGGYARLERSMVRDLSRQLITGVEYCHRHRIFHRDLKPQNLLIMSKPGQPPILKIADFGLARAVLLPVGRLTQEVVTVWYRAPEILLGQDKYSNQVDMWSVGCIVAEMASGLALFMGDCEIATLFSIYKKLGTPNISPDTSWPGVTQLPNWSRHHPRWRRQKWADIRNLGTLLGNLGCDLVDALLVYDPARRCSAKVALSAPFLSQQGIF
eukprot:GEMP01061140.1.p1 GENE.GEMP01061140.1~~GEMP01061140.1.p1  ORF type:complete len:331 (+),score=50.28 GEMP01061140.1:107-1099(+)